ncbi:hypothetical protein SAMN02799630_05985 [Paenibacillus sp. UNCCL117]|nr:hypothetical protein SAMN04488602_1377 [Paenibacillus sp. cl123]SFW70193.1 hypothetical protein SAMN02799630_05985 [Paenibacillus sp. UNCCL117]
MEQADFSRHLRSPEKAAAGSAGQAPDKARSAVAGYAVYLHIWGFTQMISAVCLFAAQFRPLPVPASLIPAAGCATAVIVFAYRRLATAGKNKGSDGSLERRPEEPSRERQLVAAALFAVACLALLIVLTSTGVIGSLDGYIGKGLLAAAVYAGLSPALGIPVGLLALWQLTLTVVVGWFYLGFAPVLIDGFGGAGLVALASMIQLWNRRRHRR